MNVFLHGGADLHSDLLQIRYSAPVQVVRSRSELSPYFNARVGLAVDTSDNTCQAVFAKDGPMDSCQQAEV